jgi:mono/diheme cytochrome c family protein
MPPAILCHCHTPFLVGAVNVFIDLSTGYSHEEQACAVCHRVRRIIKPSPQDSPLVASPPPLKHYRASTLDNAIAAATMTTMSKRGRVFIN